VTTVVGGVRSTVQSSVIVIGATPGSCTRNSCAPSESPETVVGEVQVWNAAPSSEHVNDPVPVQANVADVWLVGLCGVCENANGGAARAAVATTAKITTEHPPILLTTRRVPHRRAVTASRQAQPGAGAGAAAAP